MEKKAITGGKGGTGKSTVAVLYASFLAGKGKKTVLCDCDVECPNDHLLLGFELEKPESGIFSEFPELDQKKCKKCGLCVKTCRSNAVFQPPGKYPLFFKELCSGCGACWAVCPFGAIKPRKERVGEIFVREVKKNFWLVTGSARPGLEETGPAVSQTKEFALDFARKEKADVVVFDTAAGTHCPVISAIMGCDSAFAVTEPTPMGACDLELILDLCSKLEIPCQVVLNQFDLGDASGVFQAAGKYGAEIFLKIPYSAGLAESYSRGKLLEFNPEKIWPRK